MARKLHRRRYSSSRAYYLLTVRGHRASWHCVVVLRPPSRTISAELTVSDRRAPHGLTSPQLLHYLLQPRQRRTLAPGSGSTRRVEPLQPPRSERRYRNSSTRSHRSSAEGRRLVPSPSVQESPRPPFMVMLRTVDLREPHRGQDLLEPPTRRCLQITPQIRAVPYRVPGGVWSAVKIARLRVPQSRRATQGG